MKKGFTLVEMLAVIVILGFIVLIAYPSIIKIIYESRESSKNNQIKVIEKSAKEWAVENPTSLPYLETEGSCIVEVQKLLNGGYLSGDKVIDPSTKKEMGGCVVISVNKNKNKYEYKYVENCNYIEGTCQPANY